MYKILVFVFLSNLAFGQNRMFQTQNGNVKGVATVITISPVSTVTSAGGRIWMDRNLGATQVATSVTDAAAYGDLYQWGV